MSDTDSLEGERRAERPPSSYGSMRSDDHEDLDDEDLDDVPLPTVKLTLSTPSTPAGLRLTRPDSPETGITALTHQQSSIHIEGAFLTASSRNHGEVLDVEDEEPPRERRRRERVEPERMEDVPPEPPQNLAPPPEGVGLQSGIVHRTLTLPFIFKAMQDSLSVLRPEELLWFKQSLCRIYKAEFELSQLEESDVLDVVDRLLERRGRGEAVHITVRVLESINKHPLADHLENKCKRAVVQYELRNSHTRRHRNLYEGSCRPGQQRLVRDVYVEPPIFIGGDRDVVSQHEIHQPNFPSNPGTPIRANDIFRPLEGEERIRTVMMTGLPCNGLTVGVQKFVMDWTHEDANQDFQFIFCFPGRELHLVKDGDQSFLDMLSCFYPETKGIDFLDKEDCPILFIIDGLNLCKQPLDFTNNPDVTDYTALASSDALLTSLFKGVLLPHARIWVTGHRSSTSKIPARYISRFVDLKGYENAQKEAYFLKRVQDPALGARVLAHVQRSPALYCMCQFPVLCWIVSYIYERRLKNASSESVALPAITTYYTQYIIMQTNRKIERYVGTGLEASRWKDHDKDFLINMGKLALKMVQEERDVFYEDELPAFDLNLDDVATRGGISTEVMREGGYPTNGRSFSFTHYMMQEFMAALYVYLTFRIKDKHVFEQQIKSKVAKLLKDRPVYDLYKLAVDRALASKNGHLDYFLRFLFGFSTLITERHLRGHLLPQYHPEPRGMEDVVKYLNKKIRENPTSERCKNLQWCLNELEEGKDKNNYYY